MERAYLLNKVLSDEEARQLGEPFVVDSVLLQSGSGPLQDYRGPQNLDAPIVVALVVIVMLAGWIIRESLKETHQS